MDGKQRREEILKRLREGKGPVSGEKLAGELGVSRQVIVQDIAFCARPIIRSSPQAGAISAETALRPSASFM